MTTHRFTIRILLNKFNMFTKVHGDGLRWTFNLNYLICTSWVLYMKDVVQNIIPVPAFNLNNIKVLLTSFGGE
jgi:hypothetical protein